jgi:tetratricopeptide (TPR) repeat protein
MTEARHILAAASVLAVLYLCGPARAETLSGGEVKISEGTIELNSYEFSGRELEPTLFSNSTLEGTYPLPPFARPFKPGGPRPMTYRAIFLENEYLKLTVVPEFGGRVYSLYDKVNGREVFYKNDVLKFSSVNPKHSWPVGNIELTGPYDTHMLTLNNEPLWFTRTLRHPDGSASVVLSTIDPFFRMKVNFTARLAPGLAAMELSVFCYNRREVREPYMLWVNAGVPARTGSRLIYPMTRTIGHTTSEVADWPLYGGLDYSWFRNNRHMLGVFGIDIYDNFLGSYDFDLDYGTFRYADRRVVQGMKMWTWGMSKRAEAIERGYTDKAGPYNEIQSGRHVWDGHYEWLPPSGHEGWSEWWFPVAGIGGVTTANRDLALNLEVSADPQGKKSSVKLGLSSNRSLSGAEITVSAAKGQLLKTAADLAPGKPFKRDLTGLAADSAGLAGMTVRITDSSGSPVLEYRRPDLNPGRKDYTPFTSQLEKPRKPPENMSVEELILDAETKIKEMHGTTAAQLLQLALSRDPGNSRANLNLGLLDLEQGRLDSAAAHFQQAVDRDPYLDEAYYYLTQSLLEQGDTVKAERSLYLIPPVSAFYSQREYLLGRIALDRGDLPEAERHLAEAVRASGYNLSARNLLALVYRMQGLRDRAQAQLDAVLEIDPTDRWSFAERWFLLGSAEDKAGLAALLGGQSQEALELSSVYRGLNRWGDALAVLSLTEAENRDPYGTPSIFYYTKASCLKAAARPAEAAEYFRKGSQAGGNIDRWPFREESVRPLAEAVIFDPSDLTARFQLGCLLYFLKRPAEAIYQWDAAAESHPDDFSLQWTLGLACDEQGYGIDRAAEHLEAAIALNPSHIRTFTDLSRIYAREGSFDRQLALLRKALVRSPNDDYILEGLITTSLVTGDYAAADSLIRNHVFEQRHRNYNLRDKYRFLCYSLGARAFRKGDYAGAARQFELALFPPSSLGADDFQFQSAPRVHYYLGLALEKQGKAAQAKEEFTKSASGWEYLKGDRDSYNSENLYMTLALDKLGQGEEAQRLRSAMEGYARGQLEMNQREYQSEARYLLALILKGRGDQAGAREMLEAALKIDPEILGPRFELRGDVPDPLPAAAGAAGN